MLLKEYGNITILVDNLLMIFLYIGFCIKFTIAFLSVTKVIVKSNRIL